MLIKVTVDDALFPELFHRLNEFENPRLRAAIVRTLANDSLRNARGPSDQTLGKEGQHATTSEVPPASPRELLAPSPGVPAPEEMEPHTSVNLSERFDVDAIADQFASF
ncbi:hypothetical protein AWB68_02407 [Caballeronia choica]|jgi:hypothetical protein|uniref:Uncharacterized protein n=2 Tax=Caballeronia choica TaxID=326476 RepID=A0A158HY91_9BURK|nr:hypothetical protein AWB68_02407 [Caballeronia choica]